MLTAETVDQILRFDGQGLPVTSFYARVDADPAQREDLHSRVNSLVDQVNPLARDETLSHEARLSVRADLDRVKDALVTERWRPGAMAIFACAGRGLYEEVPLPRRVRDQVTVDATPYVRPTLAVLDEYQRACLVIVDKASATIWELYQDELREVQGIREPAPRQPDSGARLARDRVSSKAAELTKRHYRNVAQRLSELFRSGSFDALIIGGHDHELPAFADFLPYDLRARIAGTFSADVGAEPVADLRRQAELILREHALATEKQLVNDVCERLAAGGLAAAGIDDCLRAGSVAAVQTLLMTDSVTVPGVVCDRSGWLARSGDICPVCGNQTRATPDVLDELAQDVIFDSGSVKHVETGGRLSGETVAATLRFPLPVLTDRKRSLP